MSLCRLCIVVITVLSTQSVQASFHLRSASEELHQMRALEPSENMTLSVVSEVNATANAANAKLLKALDIDWWFLARSTAISMIITITLVVGLCVCIKFGEGKQAEQWGGHHEVTGDAEKWEKIETKMQKADVANYVEATDYQQLLKNVACKVEREKIAQGSKTGAVWSFLAKTFRINDMSSAAGAVLQAMPAQEAMHWLQLQPKAFQAGAAA